MATPSGASSLASDWGRDEYPEKIGPFQILGILGRGGMGVVFDASTKEGRKVALKVIRPQGDLEQSQLLVARFLREAKILQQLNHPGVVRLVDSGDVDGTLYLAMERIEGVSLLTIRRRGPLGFDALVQLGIQLSDALQHLHGAGVVHRDIKPANILIDKLGQPVITDFGISGMNEATGITRMGDLLGSPGFMAPEVTEGMPPSELSDQFALGRLLYELGASGPAKKLPKNAPILEILNASLEIDWNRFPSSDRWNGLEQILRRMLASDPRDRFPDANTVKAALLTLTTTDLLDVDTLSEHVGRLGVEPRMSWDLGSSAPENWIQISDPRAPSAKDTAHEASAPPPPAPKSQTPHAPHAPPHAPHPPHPQDRKSSTASRSPQSSRSNAPLRRPSAAREPPKQRDVELQEWSSNEWSGGDSGRYDRLAKESAALDSLTDPRPTDPSTSNPVRASFIAKDDAFAYAARDLLTPPHGSNTQGASDAMFNEKTTLDHEEPARSEDLAPQPAKQLPLIPLVPLIDDPTRPAPGPMPPKSGRIPVLPAFQPVSDAELEGVLAPSLRDAAPVSLSLRGFDQAEAHESESESDSESDSEPEPEVTAPEASASVPDVRVTRAEDTFDDPSRSLEATLPMSPAGSSVAAAAAAIVALHKQQHDVPVIALGTKDFVPTDDLAASLAKKEMPLYRIEGRPLHSGAHPQHAQHSLQSQHAQQAQHAQHTPSPLVTPSSEPQANEPQEQVARLEKQIARLREQLLTASRRDLGRRDESRSPVMAVLALLLACGIGLLGGLLLRRAPIEAPGIVLVPPASGELSEPVTRYKGTGIPSAKDIDRARASYASAMEHLAREDLPGAKALLAECIETADLPECHRTIGTLLSITRHSAARTHFDHYLRIAPNAPDAEAIRQLLQNR